MYQQSMFYSKKKNIKIFHRKINIFTAVKYCCILHGRVCVMLMNAFVCSLHNALQQIEFQMQSVKIYGKHYLA